ncbi:hypothetical protein Lal_00023219 [Lupinus albus]|nr:hypothetical protein Lal_00023219 [Lupinus albus]
MDASGLGWLKLNTDGAFSSTRNMAACGGMVCDHSDVFIVAFAKQIGLCSVDQLELWGILLGQGSFVPKFSYHQSSDWFGTHSEI